MAICNKLWIKNKWFIENEQIKQKQKKAKEEYDEILNNVKNANKLKHVKMLTLPKTEKKRQRVNFKNINWMWKPTKKGLKYNLNPTVTFY